MSEPNARLFRNLCLYCQVTAIGVTALGCLVLYGWAFHIEALKSILPGLVTMKVNTALGLIFSAASLLLQLPGASRPALTARTRIAQFLALLVTSIGAAALAEYFFGLNLGIDELLLRDSQMSYGTTAPGLMAPTSAVAFVAIGLALLLLNWETRGGHRPAQVLSLCTALIAMVALCGYVYHAVALTRILMYTQMAVHTAICLFLLGIAVFFARPRSSIAGEITGEGSGSRMARQFLPAVFLIPVLLGWVRLQGQYAGFYGTELGLALYVSVSIVVFAVLVCLSAGQMNREYEQRRAAVIAIRELNADLEARVAERTNKLALLTQRLSLATAVGKVGVWEWDPVTNVVMCDDTMLEIYGLPRRDETPVGSSPAPAQYIDFAGAILPEDLPAREAGLQRVIAEKGEGSAEYRIRRPDGAIRYIASVERAVVDSRDNVTCLIGVNMDITDRKEAQEALFAEKERAQVTLNCIGDAVICTDISGEITFLNVVAERMTGWTWKEASGRRMPEVFHVLDAASRGVIPNPMNLAVEENRTMNLPLNCILVRRDKVEIPIEDSVSPIHNREGKATGAVIVFRDVSAARAMTQRMTHTAQHDFLTGLPNRMLLNDRIKQAIVFAQRRGKSAAVLFLDLDGFKHINDSLGHSIGDKLLQSIAKRLVICVRATDTVSRQGGDEFVVLLSEMARQEDAAITARRMLQVIAEPHLIDQHDLHVTSSIGASVFPDDGQDAETLIKNADTAMYQAKENGRQSYRFFKSAMNERAVARQSTEEGLRRALERNELTLVYQPMVNVRSRAITSAEALLRWTHPIRGPIAPAEFIPVAEDCGLILSIGNWVLREACKQAQAWRDTGLPFCNMAVNISAMQFRDEHFLEDVFSVLQETRLNPHCLELELTESVLMKRAESSGVVLAALRAKGVQVAVDDFGTGYSSLSYLRKFPIDALKIDQSFVREISTSPDETSIVTAIIHMAQSLKLRVVGEGVETQAELLFLDAHRCDEAQGYYFSRPVPASQFAQLLASGLPERAFVEM